MGIVSFPPSPAPLLKFISKLKLRARRRSGPGSTVKVESELDSDAEFVLAGQNIV